jgi:hypothetical protein
MNVVTAFVNVANPKTKLIACVDLAWAIVLNVNAPDPLVRVMTMEKANARNVTVSTVIVTRIIRISTRFRPKKALFSIICEKKSWTTFFKEGHELLLLTGFEICCKKPLFRSPLKTPEGSGGPPSYKSFESSPLTPSPELR